MIWQVRLAWLWVRRRRLRRGAASHTQLHSVVSTHCSKSTSSSPHISRSVVMTCACGRSGMRYALLNMGHCDAKELCSFLHKPFVVWLSINMSGSVKVLTLGLVGTLMADSLQAATVYVYVASHPGQLSLPINLTSCTVGTVSASESWAVSRHSICCIDRVSVVLYVEANVWLSTWEIAISTSCGRCGGLAQLVTSLVASTKLINAGPG